MAGAIDFNTRKNAKVRKNVLCNPAKFDEKIESEFVDYLLVNQLHSEFEEFFNPLIEDTDPQFRKYIENVWKGRQADLQGWTVVRKKKDKKLDFRTAEKEFQNSEEKNRNDEKKDRSRKES